MIDKKLKEILDLVGGKAVFQDQDQYYILMTLKEFRKMRQEGVLGLTKQELVDKINNDIASWKFSQEEKKNDEIELSQVADIEEDDEVHYEKA
jgi:hypothetical protein